jgi:sugar phosphate isomerase/epimerase
MLLAGEDPASSIRRHAEILRHFHVSEPFLASFDSPVIAHQPIVEALEEIGYSNWITLEMRATAEPLSALATGVRALTEHYRQPVSMR